MGYVRPKRAKRPANRPKWPSHSLRRRVWTTRFFEIHDPGAFDEHFFNGLLKALAKKQRAYPSQRHTDGAGPYGAGGYISPAGPLDVGRAEDVIKGLAFLGEQAIFDGSNLDKPTRGSRQVAADLSKRKAGAVSKAVVKGLQDSPQALNLLHVAQTATGRHWSQE